MKNWIFLLLTSWLGVQAASAQIIVDCSCLATQAVLRVSGCQGTVPDMCLFPVCIRSTVVPPPTYTCSQTPAAGTIVGPGVTAITVTITVPGQAPVQCPLNFVVTPPAPGSFSLVCAANKTVLCGTQWNFDPPIATNACCPASGTPPNVVISVVSTVTNGICPRVFTRTWRAVDDCGQIATCSQAVTVTDNIPPTINCGPNQTVNCGTPWNFSTPVISDNCTPAASLVLTIVSTTTNGVCPQVITRVWKVADLCGNSANCTETVTIVDTTPPTINCGQNETVVCGQGWGFTVPIISDNCSSVGNGLVLSIVSTTTNVTCGQTYVATRVWLVTDACGNKTTCTQIVTVVDFTPPTIICPTNKSVPCGSAWNFGIPTALETCITGVGNPAVTIAVVSTVTNSLCPLVVTRTWSATDGCGNSNVCSQTVTVGGPGGLTLNCAALAALPELQTNACDGFVPALCSRAISLAQQNCPCPLTCAQTPSPGTQYGPGTYPITVTVSDGNGGTASCTVNFVVTAPTGGCHTDRKSVV